VAYRYLNDAASLTKQKWPDKPVHTAEGRELQRNSAPKDAHSAPSVANCLSKYEIPHSVRNQAGNAL
jgi:hypothetical protein